MSSMPSRPVGRDAGGFGGEELGPYAIVEEQVAEVVFVDALAVERLADRIANRPQAGVGLEQAAHQDDQGEGQEQAGDLAAARLGDRQEQRIAVGQRISELDQAVGAP